MNEHQADELWVRYLEGDMSAREQAALNQSLVYQFHRRDGLIDDFELDGMLQVMGHIEVTADDFVEQVVGRLDEIGDEVSEFPLASNEEDAPVGGSGDLPTTGLVSNEEDSDWHPAASRAAPPPVPPPVVSEGAEAMPRSVSEVERVAPSGFPARVGQHSRWAYALTAAALVVIALVTVIIIVAKHDGDRVAEEPDKKKPPAADNARPNSHGDKIVIEQPGKHDSETVLPKMDDAAPQVVQAPSPRPKPQPNDRDVVEIEGSPDDSVTANSPRSNPSGTSPNNRKVLARLTKSVQAVWKTEPQTELTKELLELESGIVEITMNDDVVLTILGPADFQLYSIGRVLLSEGRLNALVPAQATGFTVETPSSHVVDLGTEFDVSVDKDGETAVRVHQGEVELASLDAEPKKWSLREGQFKSLRPDGVSHDFYLATNLDRSGRGTVGINGIQFAVMDRKQFDVARERVNEEMAQFRRDVVSQRDAKYNGLMNLSGKPLRFINSSQFLLARRQTNDHFDAVQRLLDRTGSFRGSININGTEIKFDNMHDLLDQNEWMKRMGLGVPTGGVGNLRELLKLQEEVMRKLRENGADAEAKPDMRGSIDIDGKSIDFENLEELLRLRDSLRGASGLGDVDRRKRLEDMRRRHEETRDRNRERLKEGTRTEPRDTKAASGE